MERVMKPCVRMDSKKETGMTFLPVLKKINSFFVHLGTIPYGDVIKTIYSVAIVRMLKHVVMERRDA